MEKAIVSGGVILNQKNEIVLVYNEFTNNWSFPKGHVKVGENILKAALREIKEETNLSDLQLIKKLPIYSRPTKQKVGKIKEVYLFLFQTSTKQIKSNTKDITRIKWVPVDKVADHFSVYVEDVVHFNSIKKNLHP
jgi:ADP-ribose pyrophosphatase YjhB (NUDIX family)